MKVTATLKNLRTSPRKVRLVADSIVGMNTNAAVAHLQHTVKKTSEPVEKLLKSAVANAENNFGIDRDNLFVQSVLVGEGARLKRWLPRAHGRATLLLKRTSHIDLILEERVEGKNRKTKDELEKERKQKDEARKKMIEEELKAHKEQEEAQAKENEGKEAETAVVKNAPKAVKKKDSAKKAQDKGFLGKVFQRKTGA